jgi:glycosyltransferase involved in cell wall biosynthesis
VLSYGGKEIVSTAVNIIMPVYNGLPYLHEAIKSVLAQSVREWCLYLVDDGSTDGSRETLEAYAGPQVNVVCNDNNLGLYGSLSQAIRALPPGWVVILMQDDHLKPDYLECMLAVAVSQPACQAFWAAIDIIDGSGKDIFKGVDTGRIEVIEPGLETWLSGLRRGCFWTISGSFTDRDLFLRLPFVTQYPHCGDYDWLLRVLRCALLIYYERPLTEIRFHEQQTSVRHLHAGKDVQESFAIVDNNIQQYGAELDRYVIWRCCWPRVNQALRRAIAAFLQGRPRYATWLLYFCVRFALLPLLKPLPR